MSDNGYKLNGFTIKSVDEIDRVMKEMDAQSTKLWGRPLSSQTVHVIREQATKYLSAHGGTDKKPPTQQLSPALEKVWIRRFGKVPEEYRHLQSRQLNEKLEKSLKDAQKRREESLRGMGYKVPVELSRSALEEKWRERYGFIPIIEEDE